MKTPNKFIKLGFFVTLGLTILVAGIYFIGESKNLFGSTFRIYAVFSKVGGLQEGNNVSFRGIDVGTVNSISFMNDSSIKVEMTIKSKMKEFIKKDAVAMIASEGLMGDKAVDIAPGAPNSPPIEQDATIATIRPISMEDIMHNLNKTAENAMHITSGISSVFADSSLALTLHATLNSLHGTSSNLQTLSGDVKIITGNIKNGNGAFGTILSDTSFSNELKMTMVNLEKGTKSFDNNMDALSHSFLFKGYFKKKDNDKIQQDIQNAQDSGTSQK